MKHKTMIGLYSDTLILAKNPFILLRGITILSFLATCLSAQAQWQITGEIRSDEGELQSFANVVLLTAKDSVFVKGEVANVEGKFLFSGIAAGQYYCKISMVGMSSLQIPAFELKAATGKHDLGVLVLSQSLMLEAVEVVARKEMIEVRADKIVFNVSSTPSASGSNGLELLAKSPGVLVDMDRNISLLGKGGVQIYINGRPSRLSGTDLANLLENMSSDNIEDIEIISNPSSQYEAEGDAGIINLNLKRNLASGFNGSLSYTFTQGKYFRNNQNFTLNYGGTKLNASFGISRTDSRSPDTFLDQKDQNGFTIQFDSRELRKLQGNTATLSLDYQLAKNHSLQLNALASLNVNDDRLNSETGISFPDPMQNDQILRSQTLLDRQSGNYNLSLNYRWRISENSTLNADISGGTFTTLGETFQPNTFFEADGSTVIAVANNGFDSNTYIDLLAAKLDYDRSWDRFTLATGVRFATVATDNRFNFFNYTNGEPVNDTLRSNNFSYLEEVSAAYATVNLKLTTYTKLTAGMRVEHTQSRGLLESSTQIENSDVSRAYTNFFPNLALSFNDERNHAISIGVGRRITRPNYQSLNPFESPLSQLQAWKGNPFLNPSYATNVQLSHVFKRKLTTIFAYTRTTDFFSTIWEIVDENATILIPRNMQQSTNYNVSVSFPQEVNDYWEFITFVDAGYQIFDGNLAGTVIDLQNQNWNFRMQNNFNLPGGMQLEVTYSRYSDWIWRGSVLVRGNQRINYGLRKSFFDKKLEVRLTGSDIFRTDSEFNYSSEYGGLNVAGVRSFDNRRFGAGATWKFGNAKVKGVKSKGAMDDELRRLQGGD